MRPRVTDDSLPSVSAPADSRGAASPASPKLLDRVRQALGLRHYSRRTEEAYVLWIRRFIIFHGKRHPKEMGAPEVTRFLTWLALKKKVSASTQNQALSALLFLYKDVLGIAPGSFDGLVRARRPQRVPVVLSRAEVAAVLAQLEGTMWLIMTLLYGAGLRLQECLELRVKDIDFDRNEIVVRRGKGQKDRVTMLPGAVKTRLVSHLVRVRRLHDADLERGFGRVALPGALDRKYPGAAREWAWQYVFPAARVCTDSRWGEPSRFHLHESAVQRAMARAVRRARITKHVSCHSLRSVSA